MNPIIEVKDVTFTYSGAQRHALERISLPLRRSWLAVLNVIDYMPGDTLLHKLNPVAKVALAMDCRNDPRTCTKGADCSTPFVHVREWRVCK